MIIKQKNIYYCEYCKKYRLNRVAMKIHEARCTLNPNRVCRLCNNRIDEDEKRLLKNKFKELILDNRKLECEKYWSVEGSFVDKLNEYIKEMKGIIECPICLFSIIRQAIKDENMGMVDYNLKRELKEYWGERNAYEQ